jgi:hypothetical protein
VDENAASGTWRTGLLRAIAGAGAFMVIMTFLDLI